MRRLVWILLAFVPLLGLGSRVLPVVTTAEAQQATLEQTLLFGLEARTPKERTYLKTVARYVDEKKLPRSIVMKAFRYVRKRHRYENRKVFVFQQTLRRLVKRAKITDVKV